MYNRDGQYFKTPRSACTDLWKRTGVLVQPTRKDIIAVLESYGYKEWHAYGYRAFVDKWNAKLKRRIRKWLRKIGRLEKYFV